MAEVLGFINHAENFYGTDQFDTGSYSSPSVWLTNIPRMKYTWTVEFVINNPVDSTVNEMIHGNGAVGSITNIAKSVQMPDLQFSTVTLNQYNKKRHVHTTGEWQPIQIVFHDTVSNRLEKILRDYRDFYWASEGATGLKHIRDRDQTSDQFNSQVGMRAIPLKDDNYFKSIAINREWMGKVDQYILINPKITAFTHDTLDYTSSDTLSWTLTVSYEGVELVEQQYPSRPDGPNLEYVSYKGHEVNGGGGSNALGAAMAGLGLGALGMSGGAGTPPGDTTGGFSSPDSADATDNGPDGPGAAGTDSMSGSDPTWADQISDKYKSIKENVAGAYQDAQNFSIGGIPVGKAINPQNIGTTLAIGAAIYSTGGKALKNPAFLLGVVNKVASGIPGANKYLNSGALQTAAVVAAAATSKNGLKGLATVGAISAGYALLGGTSSQTPMQSFLQDKNHIEGRF
jgi:hypothetical protein